MPTKKLKQFTAWSYSRLDEYHGCPLKAKLHHLDKLPQPPAPALERGSLIHKMAEDYTTGQLKKLPAELKLFAEEFKALVKMKTKLRVEQETAFDVKWAPVDWFSPYTWVRIKMDLVYPTPDTMVVVDYKTGRVNPKHGDQLELYAVSAFLMSSCDRIDTKLWYLDQGEVNEKSFMRSELKGLQKKWEKKATPMLRDRKFSPTPGNACTFCCYAKKKGGPCAY